MNEMDIKSDFLRNARNLKFFLIFLFNYLQMLILSFFKKNSILNKVDIRSTYQQLQRIIVNSDKYINYSIENGKKNNSFAIKFVAWLVIIIEL